MSAEELRAKIIEKQRPMCSGEPGPHAVANYLAAFQWNIYHGERWPDLQEKVMMNLGYDNVPDLQADATALALQLRYELDSPKWELYFGELNIK